MDTDRFDKLARALTATPSRRGVGRAFVGFTLAAVLARSTYGAGAGAKKKKCGPCQTRKKGKCTGHKPDDARCRGDGKCLAGTCNPRPTCPSFGAPCTGAAQATDCCSSLCRLFFLGSETGTCTFGEQGAACVSTTDCHPRFSCVGYRCQ